MKTRTSFETNPQLSLKTLAMVNEIKISVTLGEFFCNACMKPTLKNG